MSLLWNWSGTVSYTHLDVYKRQKLDFLMQAMIKTSRLETGVISLEKKEQPIYDTLAAALGGILLNAEKKQIDVQVDCPEHLKACYDRKWTSEALFNILDLSLIHISYCPSAWLWKIHQRSIIRSSSYLSLIHILCLLAAILYYIVVPCKIWRGQTLGKHLLGLRIVRKDGKACLLYTSLLL